VTSESLRFDFNHYESISDEQILELERKVNDMIQESHETVTHILTVDEAVKKGAIAEFGEKYDEYVRVVDLKHTLDLCGGTHVSNIRDIDRFAVRSISSIGSGIYRIEGLTNINVDKIDDSLKGINQDIENLLKKADFILEEAKKENIILSFDKTLHQDVIGSYQDVLNKRHLLSEVQVRVKDIEKEFARQKEIVALNDLTPYLSMIQKDTLIGKVQGIDISVLKQLVDNLLVKLQKGTVLLGSILGDKVVFIAKTNKENVHAGNLVKKAAILCGGNGGGRPDFAQAGGKDVSSVDFALKEVRDSLL